MRSRYVSFYLNHVCVISIWIVVDLIQNNFVDNSIMSHLSIPLVLAFYGTGGVGQTSRANIDPKVLVLRRRVHTSVQVTTLS